MPPWYGAGGMGDMLLLPSPTKFPTAASAGLQCDDQYTTMSCGECTNLASQLNALQHCEAAVVESDCSSPAPAPTKFPSAATSTKFPTSASSSGSGGSVTCSLVAVDVSGRRALKMEDFDMMGYGAGAGAG